MKMGKMSNKSISAYLALATGSLLSCGKVQVKSTGGNAILVLDATKDVAVTDQELTLKRLRVWKSAPNNVGPGVVSLVDSYVAEIWFRATGDENDQYAMISDLQSDSNGDLFVSSNRPGKVVSEISDDNNLHTYTVTAQDGFIREKFEIYYPYSISVTGGGSNPKVASLKAKSARELGVSEWANLFRFSMTANAQLYSRNRVVENTTGLGARAVCTANKITTATSSLNFGVSPATNKLDLGIYYDTAVDNDLEPTDANGKSNERSDDKLYANYFEQWYVTGINVNTKSVRTLRARTAGIYASRHLKADTSATSPAESGYNKVIRECNVAAKPGTGETATGNVIVVSASINLADNSPLPLNPIIGPLKKLNNVELDDHPYCAALESATAAKDYMVSLVNPANGTPPGLECGPDWATVETGEEWSAADGYSVSVGSTINPVQFAVEQTAITTSTF